MNDIWLINLDDKDDLVKNEECTSIRHAVGGSTKYKYYKKSVHEIHTNFERDECGLNGKICSELNCPIKDSYKHKK